VSDWSPLLAQRSLRFLTLHDCPTLDTLDKLPLLDNLRGLRLDHSSLAAGPRDLIDRVPQLEVLHLSLSPWMDDLAPLTSLNLRSLGLLACESIVDFTPLAEMTHLDYLDLEGSGIGSLTPLGQLVNLETLRLGGCADVTDLTPLASLRRLRDLNIEGVSPGIDLAPLADIKNITVYIRRGQDVRHRNLLGRRVRESA
jgi:internalin A